MKTHVDPETGVRGTHPKYGEVRLVAKISESPAIWVIQADHDDELHLAKEVDFEEFFEYTEW